MDVKLGASAEIIAQAQAIRFQVFTQEQGIGKDLDKDGLDEQSMHALVIEGNTAVATARLYQTNDTHAVLARVAVLKSYRKQGLAGCVVDALMRYARQHGVDTVDIHAHQYLRDYYQKHGFSFIKNVEVVAGHQLIEMRYQHTPTESCLV
ncbi:GNAT family N-acetyltransferase [Vibrio sp. WXL103]|uniref:GNAT family N-acetyltransferase n=1 Tax=Vibrio sp. WXL103 TaxID=3450710 RepID=UPI003EC570B7